MNINSFNTGFSYQQSPVKRKIVSFGEDMSDPMPVQYTVVSGKLIKVSDLRDIDYHVSYLNLKGERLKSRLERLAANSIPAEEDNIKEIDDSLVRRGMYLEMRSIEHLTSGYPSIDKSIVNLLKSCIKANHTSKN